MGVRRFVRTVAVFVSLLAPSAALAQSSISGVVRDSSGAVLPGVTVEATSPAMIEGSRAAVTDGQGLYRLVDLRPGPYAVTFTLPGFNTFRREGIDLRAAFTATVNAELSVGALEETVTVTGEAPLVDVRSSGAQTQFQRETLDALPGTGRLALLSAVIPGASLTSSADRGNEGGVQTRFSVHGAPEAQPVVDGINQQLAVATRGVFVFSQLNIQEVVADFAGNAEADFGGTQLKMIPREGGNTFSGQALLVYSGSGMEQKNITDELIARRLNPERIGSLKKYRDSGVALGGPIKQSTLWFYVSAREGVNQLYADGVQWNKLRQPQSLLYEPDFSRRVFTDDYQRDLTGRLTWQAAEKHKIVVATSHQPNCNCVFGILTTGVRLTPEAAGPHAYNPNYTGTLAWTSPMTNRVLLEGTGAIQFNNQNDTREPGWDHTPYRITDQALNLTYGNVPTRIQVRRQYQGRFSMSYVSGTHQMKTGVMWRLYKAGREGVFGDVTMNGPAVDYRFNNGVPNQLTLRDAPWNFTETTRDVALFVQDQWIVRQRLTLNLGLRYNDANGSTPEQILAAGYFVPERRFAPMNNVPHYQNLSPRVGAAFDLFGDARTALKVSLGHYPDIIRVATGNPVNNLTRTVNRTWNDLTFPVGDPRRGNFVPDCDLRNPVANAECGAWSNLTFGQVLGATRFQDGLLEGFNSQYHNWQTAISLQHELTPKVGLNVGYFRTWYGGNGGGSGIPQAETSLWVTDNLLIGPADHDPYCITAPPDSRLPGGGGNQLCGLYDVKNALFNQVDSLIRPASDFGGRLSRVYNGVDATVTSRFGQGGQFSGGVSMGRTVTDDCLVVDSPQSARPGFCKVERPWAESTDIKLLLVYPLPLGIQTSAIYQNSAGIPIAANLVVSNAAILPSLGRNLSDCALTAATCTANRTIPLIAPQTMFEPRFQQVDLRFSRTFGVGRGRVRGNLDVFNLFNASAVLAMNTTYGPNWLDVTQIQNGRQLRVGAQWEF